MKGINRAVAVFFCIVFTALCFASCSKREDNYTPQMLTDELKSYFAEDIRWIELKRENISAHFGFDGGLLADFSASITESEGNNDIVAVFVFGDKQSQLTATEAIGKSLAGVPLAQNDKKAKSVLVLSKGNETVVVVSNNTEKIAKMLNKKGYKV